MTTTQTELTQRNHRHAVGFFWAWLILATSVSLAGNVAHAWLTAEPSTQWLAGSVAAVPPTALLLAVHGLAVLARRLPRVLSTAPRSPRPEPSRWVRSCCRSSRCVTSR